MSETPASLSAHIHTRRHRGYCPVSFPLTTHTSRFISTSASTARVNSHIHTIFPTHIPPCILDTRRKLPSYTRPSPVYYPPTHIPHRHINRAISSILASTTTYKANLPASATRTSTSSPVHKPIPTTTPPSPHLQQAELEAQLAPIPLTSTGTLPTHKPNHTGIQTLEFSTSKLKSPPT